MIRAVDQYANIPFVSNNAVVNNVQFFSRTEVICQGLEGHGQLQWILPDSGPGLSTSSVGPRQQLLTISHEIEFPNKTEFRCESMESGASASFYYSTCELQVISGVHRTCSVTRLPLYYCQFCSKYSA